MKISESRIRQWEDGRPRPSSTVFAAIQQSLALIRTILREIFDESAYERFLAQHHLTSSARAYASFCRDHDQTKARRPRCC